jgi:hypothetical protein
MAGLWPISEFIALPLSIFSALILPVILVWRVSQGLASKGAGQISRRILEMSLFTLIHLALIAAMVDWAGRSPADFAATGHRLLQGAVGELPVLSNVLKNLAEGSTQPTAYASKTTLLKSPGVDGGVASLDGGVSSTALPSPVSGLAKIPEAGEQGQRTDADGGSVTDLKPVATPQNLKPVKRAPPALHVGIRVQLENGQKGIWHQTVSTNGQTRGRWISLDAYAHQTNATALHFSSDGHGAVVLGKRQVLFIAPAGQPRLVAPLQRGAVTPSGLEIRNIHQVLVGPAGSLLAIVDTFKANLPPPYDTGPTLVHWKPEKPAQLEIYRRVGETVPEAPGQAVVELALKTLGADGAFVLLESYRHTNPIPGQNDGPNNGRINAQRLMVAYIDAPHARQEVIRTGQIAGQLPAVQLQSFQDAATLTDGRVFFDANFIGDPRRGWVFAGETNSPVIALAASSYPDQAPWPTQAPRLIDFSIDSDGTFVFVNPKQGLVVGHVDRFSEAKLLWPLMDKSRSALSSIQHQIKSIRYPRLVPGGKWIFFQARLKEAKGDVNSIILASREKTGQQNLTVLLKENQPLPKSTRFDSSPIRTLRLNLRHDDPSWFWPE